MKRRLRFFITSLEKGGAEKVLSDLLSQLDARRYTVQVDAVYGGENERGLPAWVSYHKLVKNRNGFFNRLRIKLLLKMPPFLFARLFLRGSFDCETAYLEGRATRMTACKKTAGKKIAFVHCDLSVANKIAPLYRSKDACLQEYRSFNTVCFVSKDAQTGFEAVYGKLPNAQVLPGVLNVARVREMAEQPADTAYTAGGLKMVAVGRLTTEKNYGMLLSVIAELEKQFPLELLLLGDGELRAALEEQIRKEQIQNVRLLGYCENPYPYIRMADVLVSSSLFEGYSTVVCEAVALHTPVLTTDCAGMADILQNGRFGMITGNSREAFRNGMEQLLCQPSILENYRAALRSYCFDNAALLEQYDELFGESAVYE